MLIFVSKPSFCIMNLKTLSPRRPKSRLRSCKPTLLPNTSAISKENVPIHEIKVRRQVRKKKKLPCEICAGLVVVTATCSLDVGMHSSANLHVAGEFEMQGQKANWRVIARAIDDGERGDDMKRRERGNTIQEHKVSEQQTTHGKGSMTRVRNASSDVAQWNPRLLYTA
jgi:hypothetical protein